MSESVSASWNPWHGCTKISPGCKYCYVYRQDEMYGAAVAPSLCRKTAGFELPVKRKRDGSYRIAPGSLVYTCFTSDFLLPDADAWRSRCWEMIRERSDCLFCFFTKRIDRLAAVLPDDWGEGYENVIIGCTVEDQERADYRLPIFLSLPIRFRMVVCAPLLDRIDLRPYLDERISEVMASGESGAEARPCDLAWILDLRSQAMERNIPFRFHQTGAHFLKNGKLYNVPRRLQGVQARKAGLDWHTGANGIPKTAEDCLRKQEKEVLIYDLADKAADPAPVGGE